MKTRPSVKATNTRSGILNIVREKLYELDAQQVHIGLAIPPGAQRIRGIAGSGKTVLLCQKGRERTKSKILYAKKLHESSKVLSGKTFNL
ncbi:MAG: hypothetical protein ACHBN1_02830 [Heteroscytonema crispum UTEX LB 1556]